MSGSDVVLAVFTLASAALAGLFVWIFRAWRARRLGRAAILAGNLVLTSALLLAALGCAEIYYRFLYDGVDGADLGLASERWLARHYRSNSVGVRDDIDYPLRREPGTTRITVLGDSFANGHGLEDVNDRFIQRLRHAHPEWEVHFAGEDGMDTGAIVERLAKWLATGYEIDVVLYAYCLNDISDLNQDWLHAADRIYGERLGYFTRNSWALNTWHYRLLSMWDPGLADYFDVLARSYEGPDWSAQQQRLRELDELVRGHGGRLIVVTLPFPEKLTDAKYRAIHEQLRRFWQAIGVPDLDLFELYAHEGGSLAVSRRDTHPNARAHAITAAAIEAWLPSAGVSRMAR
jgi:lysophospholipase L1-like esterase